MERRIWKYVGRPLRGVGAGSIGRKFASPFKIRVRVVQLQTKSIFTLNLAKSRFVVTDLHLLCSFHTFFFFPHNKFLQLGDKQGVKTSSHQSRNVMIRYFFILKDLTRTKQDWETIPKYTEYVSTLNELSENDKVVPQEVHSLL